MADEEKGGDETANAEKPKLAAANGTPIAVAGEAILEFENNGRQCMMKFIDADVKRPLGSVADMMDGGNDVHFVEEGSYIENRRTKERIPIERRDRTFILTLNGIGTKNEEKGKRKKENNAGMEVDGLEERGGIEEE